MAENSKIEWTKHTFNPWMGCTKVNEACANCYAEALMDTRYGKVQWGPRGTRVPKAEAGWREPVKWNKLAAAAGERHRVFCASLADVFEDRDELIPHRARLFDMIDATPNLDWLLLTKRPENIRRLWVGGYRANVWRGASAGLQKHADVAIPHLRSTNDLSPIAFLSCEPLLGHIDLRHGIYAMPPDGGYRGTTLDGIHWVIVGGESGSNARPCNVADIRWIVAQCKAAGVAVHVKQLGKFCRTNEASDVPNFWIRKPDASHSACIPTRDSKGGDWSEWPEDLRVREYPKPSASIVTL